MPEHVVKKPCCHTILALLIPVTALLAGCDGEEERYRVGGEVSGLDGSLTLQNNGMSNLSLTSSEASPFRFKFRDSYAEGDRYHVTIASAPAGQQCTVSNASGTLSADVTTVDVRCLSIPEAPADLAAWPGDGEMTLTWSAVPHADSYHLYWATESGVTPEHYAAYQDGTWLQNVTSPVTVGGLTNGQAHYFIVTAVNALGESNPSGEVSGVPVFKPALNDTGIDWCADGASNNLACPVTGYDNQDGEFGRDVTHADDSDGRAGFSFTKLDANGAELDAGATAWSCVKDNVTGLIWEVKTTDGGLRDAGHTYTWYNPDSTTNGGDAGTANGGTCVGSDCDTASYVQAVNAAGLCGVSDWRMPTVEELVSIADYGRSTPHIDIDYFPNIVSGHIWSSSASAEFSDRAWGVYAGSLGFFGSAKSSGYKVRLVRIGQ